MRPVPNAIDLILDEIAERDADMQFVANGSETEREIDAEIHGLCTAIDLMWGVDDTYGRLIIEREIEGRVTARSAKAAEAVRDFLSGNKTNLSIIK